MAQPEIVDLTNSATTTRSDIKEMRENLALLCEMFPNVSVNVLQRHLEIFQDNPNCMAVIVSILIEGQNTQTFRKQDQISVGSEMVSRNALSNTGRTEASQSKTSEQDSGNTKASCTTPMSYHSHDSDVMIVGDISSHKGLNQNDFHRRNSSGTAASPNDAGEGGSSCKNNSIKRQTLSQNNTHGQHPSDAMVSPRKAVKYDHCSSSLRVSESSFHRSCDSAGKVKQGGVCIRHNKGALHPSMHKPKILQIMRPDSDQKGFASNPVQDNYLPPAKPSSLNTNSISSTTVTHTTTTARKYDLSMPGSSTGLHESKPKLVTSSLLTQSPVTGNISSKSPESHSKSVTENTIQTDSKVERSAVLSDLEILQKVFPHADSEYISELLEKHDSEENRVAIVGQELAKNHSSSNQATAKKKAQLTATWFWETHGGKLVPFTSPECNTLEQTFHGRQSWHHSPHLKIKLPGSSNVSTFDFHAMTLADSRGQKSTIFRVPCDGQNTCGEGEIGGKNLIPHEELAVPRDWQQQSASVVLTNVRPGSAEWEHIEHNLKRSMKRAIVTDIQRVQNKWLYRKYAIQRHLLKDKNGPTCINEKELFHGTRTTDPACIWKGEDGFDMRYSADGMWGRGTYFAEKASYCHHGFTYFDPEKQCYRLFLAHVLTGESVTLAPDRLLRMPPLKVGSNVRYDSVKGVANDCTVYILYKLDMAYPAYLITYRMG